VLLAIEARPGGLQILPQPLKFTPALYQPVISLYTDKKENQIFLIYKEILNGAVEKSYVFD
jgi:hypothetical protein